MDMGVGPRKLTHVFVVLLISLVGGVINGETDSNDFKILNDFRKGIENSDLLGWPERGNDPCGPPAWPHVVCSKGRVTKIDVQGLGLKGHLPQNLNQLEMLEGIVLQRNHFIGNLPSLSGLSYLQYAYLGNNEFDSIPPDSFRGLRSLKVLALDRNPFYQTSGWTISDDLAECTRLVNFSCSNCNIIGRIPEFFGRLSSLNSLRLSSNRLSGEIPLSFRNSLLQILCLNDQQGGGLNGSIGVIGTMVFLTKVWLNGNQFTGPIPDSIGSLLSLRELNLQRNRLIGLIPQGLISLNLLLLDLDDNMFMGPIPKFNATKVSYNSNSFCQSVPSVQCAPETTALLSFLHHVNYPERLALEWKGNEPCVGPWWGITCNLRNEVSVINLQSLGLNGTLCPSLGNLPSLTELHIQGNNLHGVVPEDLTRLKSLRLLDLSGNRFQLPLPRFRTSVKIIMNNMSFGDRLPLPPSSDVYNTSEISDHSDGDDSSVFAPDVVSHPKSITKVIVASFVGSVIFTLLVILLVLYCLKKRKDTKKGSIDVMIHPKDTMRPAKVVTSALEAQNGGIHCRITSNNSRVIESGSIVFSLRDLQGVTNNFSQENTLGRGGFGVVYKGKLEDGITLAVKRMEAGVISDKALNEFETEIAVLSTVRHRNLVALLGYSVEGNERLLVYEYMPQGALSQHLFRWKSLNVQPLSWKNRLNIALDVAKGVEYLHTMAANQSFIHRDLKSANILLDDDFRAKISDFGLVKLALDSESSIATRLAGTFGYLAPEYAVTGKITTKVDVFSFGVILMELLTGLVAVDERRPEEKQYLVEWFWQIKTNRETLLASIDPSLNASNDIYESIFITAELAGHCTIRDPNSRPDMGHVVNVLSQLVETWKPKEENGQCSDNNSTLSLPQLVEGWKTEDFSGDSKESLPARS